MLDLVWWGWVAVMGFMVGKAAGEERTAKKAAFVITHCEKNHADEIGKIHSYWLKREASLKTQLRDRGIVLDIVEHVGKSDAEIAEELIRSIRKKEGENG